MAKISSANLHSFVVAVALLVLPQSAAAQLTRGAVSGTVVDTTGAAVPGASVTARNVATNIARTAVTDGNGFYRIPALEPGRYLVAVEMPGFSRVENRDIEVRTTQEVTFDVAVKVSTMSETVDVTAEAGAVHLNKSNPTLGMTATQRQAVDLPLSAGRAINNLALLSPNVNNSVGAGTTSVGQSNISANGQTSRNNNYTIDGSDNNDVSVTIQTTPVIPEAVAEFQVQTNAYNAEFGRNSGAQLNIITRSGGNAFHGDLFEYYRGSDLAAMDNLEKAAGRTDPARFNRNQAGFTLGGPIRRDKTFFFILGQADRLRSSGALGAAISLPTQAGFASLGSVPLAPGQTAAGRQQVLSQIQFLNDVYGSGLVLRNVRTIQVNGVPVEIGTANVARSEPNNSLNILTRIDNRFGEKDSATARLIYNRSVTDNTISNTNFGALFSGQQTTNDTNLALSETHIFSGTFINEARFSWIRRDLQFPENDPTSPTATITGFFTIGGSGNFPQGRLQDSFQFSDVATLHRGRHSIKFGADIRRVHLDNLAAFDSKGTFLFGSFQDYLNNTATSFSQALQTASFNAKTWQTFLFAQDDYRVTPELTLNFGLRYEISTAPFGFFGATDPASLAALVPGPVRTDKDNFAPKLGFNWSPRSSNRLIGDGRTVFRGGYGRGYDVLFSNILTVNASNFPRVVVARQDIVRDVYPNLLPVSAQAVFNPLATFVNTPENAENPESDTFSLSAQREMGVDYVVEVGYSGSRNRNGISQGQANPAILTPEQAATVVSTGNPSSIPTPQQRRVDPRFGSRVLIMTGAKSQYDALFASLNKRMSHGIQLGAAYTFSRLMSDGDESLALGFTASSPQVPQDYFNLDAEWSRSAFDRPHRLVVHYIWEIPFLENSGNGFLRTVVGGWQIAGVIQGQAGRPFTITTGQDTNGNGAGGDRPNYTSGCELTPDPTHDDLRTFKDPGCFTVPRGANGVPILYSLGNGNLGRNTYRGPGFWQTDLSLSKRFRFGGEHALMVRADALNVFNHDNVGNPVSNMSSPTFGQNLNNWGNRSITLGAKYSF